MSFSSNSVGVSSDSSQANLAATPSGTALPLATIARSTSLYSDLTSVTLELAMSFSPQSLPDCVLVNKYWQSTARKVGNAIIDNIKGIGLNYSQCNDGLDIICGPTQWQNYLGLTNPPFAPSIPMEYLREYEKDFPFGKDFKDFKFKLILIPDKIEINNVNNELTPDVLKKIYKVRFQDQLSVIQKNIPYLRIMPRPNGAYWVAYKPQIYLGNEAKEITKKTYDQSPHIWDLVSITFLRYRRMASISAYPRYEEMGTHHLLDDQSIFNSIINYQYIRILVKSGNSAIRYAGFRPASMDNCEMDFCGSIFPCRLNLSLITRRSRPATQTPASNSSSSLKSNAASVSSSSSQTSHKQVKSFFTSNFFITALKIGDFIPGISFATNIYTLFKKRAYKKAATDPSSNIKETRNYIYFKNKPAGRCFLLMIPGLNIIVTLYHLCKSHKKTLQSK